MKKIEYVVYYGRKTVSAYGEWTSWVDIARGGTLSELSGTIAKLVDARKQVIRVALLVDDVISSEVTLNRDFYETMENANEVVGYIGLYIMKTVLS